MPPPHLLGAQHRAQLSELINTYVYIILKTQHAYMKNSFENEKKM